MSEKFWIRNYIFSNYPEMPITKVLIQKHPDFVLTSADTSIKVTVLPLTYMCETLV